MTLEYDPLCDRCCNHGDVTTPYCPYCGKPIKGHGLTTLLAHCKVSLAAATVRYEASLENEHSRPETIKHRSDLARKWRDWTTAIEGAITKLPKE